MEQPYVNMSKPHKDDYDARVVDIAIFNYYEPFRYDNDDDHEMDEEDLENHRSSFPSNDGPKDGASHWYSGYKDQPKLPNTNINKIRLKDIIHLIPDGITADDIKISINIDRGSGGVYGQEISFYYSKKLPAEPEKYEEDLAIWENLRKEYETKKLAYDNYIIQKDIDLLEKQLSNLKTNIKI